MMRVACSKSLIAVAVAGILAGCGGDNDDDNGTNDNGSADTTAEVRVVHASSDAPAVEAGLDGGSQVPELAYATATQYLEVDASDYEVEVSGILPDGSTQTVIGPATVPLDAGNETSIFAVGNVGDGSIAPLVVTAPDADPASGEVRTQVVHASAAAAAAGPLDVYVTAPGDDLSADDVNPLGTFEFKGSIGPATVPGGDYRIRVTPEGSPGMVVFDSGTVELAGGSDLTIAAIDNTGPSTDTSPVRLLVAPEGADSFVLRDAGSNTSVRAAHVSDNAPGTVDIEVNGAVPGALDDFSFGNVSGYLSIASGKTDIEVLDDSGGSLGVSVSGLPLAPQSFNTAYAINDGGSVELIATQDDLRSVATEVGLRVVHAAQNATGVTPDGIVDVYALPDGTTPAEVGADGAAIEDLAYRDTVRAALPGGATYDLFVTPADNPSNPVIEVQDFQPTNGEVYTIIARDDGMNFAAILENDTQ